MIIDSAYYLGEYHTKSYIQQRHGKSIFFFFVSILFMIGVVLNIFGKTKNFIG